MEYVTHILAMIVKPVGEPIFSELATTVRVDDEAAGPFVVLEQTWRTDHGKVGIDKAEWPQLRDAVDKMLSVCEDIEAEEKPQQETTP